MKYKKDDYYHQLAKEEGYSARSAFKLKEILDKYPDVCQKQAKVLDLGCSPGAWSQVLLEYLGREGSVLGIDLVQADDIRDPRFTFLCVDIFEWQESTADIFDLIVSDMAPKTTGVRVRDHLRSVALCERAVAIANDKLLPGGTLIMKIFEGGEINQLVNDLRKDYQKVARFRPKSTRSASKEIYLVAMNKRT